MIRTNFCRLMIALALLGYLVGTHLESPQDRSRKVADVGEHLVAAQTNPQQTLVAGLALRGGQWYVTAYDLKGEVRLMPQRIPAPTGVVNRLSWSDKPTRFAVAAGDCVHVYDLEKGVDKKVLKAAWQVREVRFCGKFLMARANDNVFVWDMESRGSIKVHYPYVLHADLTRDGRFLALGAFEDGIRVLDLKRRRQLHHIDPALTPAMVRLCDKDRQIVSSYRLRSDRRQDHAVMHDLQTGKPTSKEMFHPFLLTAQVTSDGRRLLTRSADRSVVWDVPTSRKLVEKAIPDAYTDALSPDGARVATAVAGEPCVKIWETEQGEDIDTLSPSTHPSFLSFSGVRNLDVTAYSCSLWEVE